MDFFDEPPVDCDEIITEYSLEGSISDDTLEAKFYFNKKRFFKNRITGEQTAMEFLRDHMRTPLTYVKVVDEHFIAFLDNNHLGSENVLGIRHSLEDAARVAYEKVQEYKNTKDHVDSLCLENNIILKNNVSQKNLDRMYPSKNSA